MGLNEIARGQEGKDAVRAGSCESGAQECSVDLGPERPGNMPEVTQQDRGCPRQWRSMGSGPMKHSP